MTSSVVADFLAHFVDGADPDADPRQGRVLLGEDQLVIVASADERIRIALDSVFDVALGEVPEALRPHFDGAVVLGYERDDERRTVVVESESDVADRFADALFKTILNGTEATIRHPALEDGRVRDPEPFHAPLYVTDDGVSLRGDGVTLTIDPGDVVGFGRTRDTIAGRECQLLQVRHLDADRVLSTHLAIDSGRKRALLGRYLYREYGEAVSTVRDLDLSTEETRALVALYAGADPSALESVLGEDAPPSPHLLETLAERDLLSDADSGTLTRTGKIAADEFAARIAE
jgi:helix-turn-helix protein